MTMASAPFSPSPHVEVITSVLTTAKTFTIRVGDAGLPLIQGSTGSDQFLAGDHPAHFIGLSGLDAVTFSGPAADYAIEKGPHGMLYVTGPHGTDTLSSIERLQFDDGTLAFDTGGTAGQMFRLYQAAFGREPDVEGLGYHRHHRPCSRYAANMAATLSALLHGSRLGACPDLAHGRTVGARQRTVTAAL